MNILILGGTGAMGVHLVNILAESSDNSVYVTTRKNRISSKSNISYISGDAHGTAFIDSILAKQQWVAIVDFMVYNTEEFKARADKMLCSCSQYVFLSSSRVYAESKEPLTENSPRLLDVCNDKDFLATDEYALTKARQENILFENEKKNWTIIRPYITYSENRLQLGVFEKEIWLFAALNCGALVFSKDVAQHRTTLTYGFDVARGIAAIIGRKEAFGEAFHVTGNNAIQWQKVFEIYAETLRKNGIEIEEILKEKNYRLENERAKYQLLYDRYYDRIFDNSKIARFIDVYTFSKPEDTLGTCLVDLLRTKKFSYISVREILNLLKDTGHSLPFSKIPSVKQKIKYILIKLHIL